MKTGFIGAGNMGGAILRSFASSEHIRGSLYVYSRTKSKTEKLAEELGIRTCDSAAELAAACDIIIIGVKPDTVAEIIKQIKPVYTSDKIVISMAAGISISAIEDMLGKQAKIIRIMPNTPVAVGEGMTAIFVNGNISKEDRQIVYDMFSQSGRAEFADESLIHCIIGVSGSSPAYTYMYIDALAKAAQAEGMDRNQAVEFAAQSVLGAAKMVLETDKSPQELRDNVCSPGGTTIEAVKTLQQNGFLEKLTEGFDACVRKSEDMSK